MECTACRSSLPRRAWSGERVRGGGYVASVNTKEATMTQIAARSPWAEVLTLGDARFGILVGGPFDGRCNPLLDATPATLDVPGPDHPGQPATLRYVLRDGYYRYAGAAVPALPAA
jgi:hypothetical protein